MSWVASGAVQLISMIVRLTVEDAIAIAISPNTSTKWWWMT
jgi:hypothetical protein